MQVEILQLIEGAKKAQGLTVIIDVFRAFLLEAYMFAGGVKKIFPVGKSEIAYELKAKNPDYILAGERGGAILPGFDIGNAPCDLYKLQLQGKTVVHTTSAGTQGVDNAIFADQILGCSLVNAKATANYIKKLNPQKVSLVCMGLAGVEPTDEDTLCARYIKAILEGKEDQIDMPKEIEKLKSTSGAKFFDPQQQSVFPKADFALCTDVDKCDFVMRLTKSDDGLNFMLKI